MMCLDWVNWETLEPFYYLGAMCMGIVVLALLCFVYDSWD